MSLFKQQKVLVEPRLEGDEMSLVLLNVGQGMQHQGRQAKGTILLHRLQNLSAGIHPLDQPKEIGPTTEGRPQGEGEPRCSKRI